MLYLWGSPLVETVTQARTSRGDLTAANLDDPLRPAPGWSPESHTRSLTQLWVTVPDAFSVVGLVRHLGWTGRARAVAMSSWPGDAFDAPASLGLTTNFSAYDLTTAAKDPAISQVPGGDPVVIAPDSAAADGTIEATVDVAGNLRTGDSYQVAEVRTEGPDDGGQVRITANGVTSQWTSPGVVSVSFDGAGVGAQLTVTVETRANGGTCPSVGGVRVWFDDASHATTDWVGLDGSETDAAVFGDWDAPQSQAVPYIRVDIDSEGGSNGIVGALAAGGVIELRPNGVEWGKDRERETFQLESGPVVVDKARSYTRRWISASLAPQAVTAIDQYDVSNQDAVGIWWEELPWMIWGEPTLPTGRALPGVTSSGQARASGSLKVTEYI